MGKKLSKLDGIKALAEKAVFNTELDGWSNAANSTRLLDKIGPVPNFLLSLIEDHARVKFALSASLLSLRAGTTARIKADEAIEKSNKLWNEDSEYSDEDAEEDSMKNAEMIGEYIQKNGVLKADA